MFYHNDTIHPDNKTVKRWMNMVGPEMLDKLLSVRMADIEAQPLIDQAERKHKCYQISEIVDTIINEQQCFQIKDLAINGHDILDLGLEPSPMVGMILIHLLDKILDGEIANDRDLLIGEARRFCGVSERRF